MDGRGDAVRRKNTTQAPSGTSSVSWTENRAALGQRLDDELVVDDLLAHVDGRAVNSRPFRRRRRRGPHRRSIRAGRPARDDDRRPHRGGGVAGGLRWRSTFFIHASTLAPTARSACARSRQSHTPSSTRPGPPLRRARQRGGGLSCGMLSGDIASFPAAPPPGGSPQPRPPAAKALIRREIIRGRCAG